MNLDQSIVNLPRTSSVTIRRLKSIGINTYWDILNYFPFRYDNYSLVSPIEKVQDGEVVTVKGVLEKISNIYTKSGLKIQKAILNDGKFKIELNWYNQPYLLRILKPKSFISVAGLVKNFLHNQTLEVKEYEILKDLNQETIHTGRLVPVYSEQKGLSSRVLREKIFWLINNYDHSQEKSNLAEFYPKEIISFNNLLDKSSAYRNIHFPKDQLLAKKARERLGFDELFIIQLSNSIIRKEWDKENVGNSFEIYKFESNLKKIIDDLSFNLTNAQLRVIEEIKKDLVKTRPMNRFLEGDVGSGKTVIAAIACYVAHLNGYQSLFMAPTEILAFQHYKTLIEMFKHTLKVCLLTGSDKPSDNEVNKADIIIGTHALVQKKIKFGKVGFVVVDEQHRFGVVQRAELKNKGLNPHLLTMTATPIPRTVALTLYGELDLSVIDEMPKGRISIRTFLVPKEKRESGYQWIKKQIKEHKTQVFIVCPLIEESEIETMKTVKAATKEFERLKKEVFPEFKLGLLHGKVKSKEKNQVMQDFKDKKIDILVATPVVEVGIDIANATIMIIEAAERFGMAQLHQLRGRVGRGSKQSYCLLYTESDDEKVLERLNLFTKTQSGIQLAEYDLKLRGPGEIFGTRQHGYMNLKIASLSDFQLIDKSKRAVTYFMNKYSVEKFPIIKKRLEEYRVKQVSRD